MDRRIFFLIFTSRGLFLYQKHREFTECVVSEDPNGATCLDVIEKARVSSLKVFDYTADQVVKIEKVPPVLKAWQFLQWYWQKRSFTLASFSRGCVRPLFRQKEVISVGIPDGAPVITFLQELKKRNNCVVQLYSGCLEQGRFLFSLIFHLKPAYAHKVLIIAINQDYTMSQWLFNNQCLSFWRAWSPSPYGDAESQILPATFSLIRYLEKITHTQDMEIVFFSECDLDHSPFIHALPSATFFRNEDLFSLAEREGTSLPQGVRLSHACLMFSRQRPWIFSDGACWRFFPALQKYGQFIFQVGGAALLIGSSYLFYGCFQLHSRNKTICATVAKLANQVTGINAQMAKIPLSVKQCRLIRDVLQRSVLQQERLWSFLEQCAQALKGRYVFRSLSFGDEKAKCSVQAVPPFQSPLFEEFLESWYQANPNSQLRVIQSPDEGKLMDAFHDKEDPQIGTLLIFESGSPFYEERP